MRERARLLATVLIAALALALLASAVDLRAAVAGLREARPTWVALAALALALNIVAKALRWRLLLGEEGRAQPPRRVVAWLLVGQGINNLTPLRLGEVARATLAGQAGVSRAAAFGSILLEKMIEMALYVGGIALLPFLLPLPSWLSEQLGAGGTLLLLLVALLFLLGGLRLVSHLPGYRGRGARLLDELRRWRDNLATLRRNRARAALASFSALSWLTALGVNYAMLRAFDLRLPLATALLLLVVLQGGLALPLVAMTVGPFEGLVVVTLSLFGVEPTRALSLAMLLHGLLLLPAVSGMVLMARFRLSPVRLKEWLWARP